MQETYQVQKLDEFRIRRIFSFFPFIIHGNNFVWTKKWFQWINIKEQKIKERYLGFDDGWTYQSYWKEWKENWEFVELVN